uniref:Calcyon neuron specific vesicular protein n=1 Tax=Gopherus agassizii TaxID=38772 RepID=A0A452GHF9_9SAUR
MVKLGNNLCEKLDKEQGTGSGDDSFDNIPLITPLDVNQLQQPFPDKVIVKTRTEYQLQQKKKRKLRVPGIKKLNINLYDEVSEKVKLTGLILITMAFLACLLMLVMYKALWYDQLSCPEGFVFKHKHCTPSALEMYYSEQEVGPQGSLYTAINHLNQGPRVVEHHWQFYTTLYIFIEIVICHLAAKHFQVSPSAKMNVVISSFSVSKNKCTSSLWLIHSSPGCNWLWGFFESFFARAQQC